jgi:hypothetical protein
MKVLCSVNDGLRAQSIRCEIYPMALARNSHPIEALEGPESPGEMARQAFAADLA